MNINLPLQLCRRGRSFIPTMAALKGYKIFTNWVDKFYNLSYNGNRREEPPDFNEKGVLEYEKKNGVECRQEGYPGLTALHVLRGKASAALGGKYEFPF